VESKFYVAVSFFIEYKEKILIGKRASWKKTGAGIWEVPAGTVIKGEQPIETVIREAKEELGINVSEPVLFDSYYFERDNKEYILLNYSCKATFIPNKIVSKEHDELRWVNKREANRYLCFDLQKKTLERYYKLKEKNCL